jgi:predicted transcriptional regulator
MSPRRASVPVAEAELIVLKALWAGGPATVRELQQRAADVGGWAYTTVQTLLQRLCDKGLVAADKRGHAHVFVPAVTREQFAGERVQEVADALLDGALAPLLLRLLPSGRFSADEIGRFRALLDQAEARAQKRRRPKGDA